jgi:sigma-E factor negative regulatory protein RseA
MTDQNKELISAYIDDDLSAEEVADMCALWDGDPELAATFTRYATVGQLMRGAKARQLSQSATLLQGVQAGIEAPSSEAHSAAELPVNVVGTHDAACTNVVQFGPRTEDRAGARKNPRFGTPRVRKFVASLAIAASVAALAVGSLRFLNGQDLEPVATPSIAAVIAAPAVAQELRWNVQQVAVEQRLNAYLVQHTEVLRHGMRGMLPYARIVGYRPSQQ